MQNQINSEYLKPLPSRHTASLLVLFTIFVNMIASLTDPGLIDDDNFEFYTQIF